jgi:hydrogenase nickel incorporation protein HypA/HybF
MHELSLCGAIADIASRRAGERPVEVIHVRIGQLRQVVPETLTFCWSMVSEGTELAGSVLAVERVPAVLRCRTCGAEAELGRQIAFACAACGGLDVDAVAGEEFLVTELELAGV